MLAFVFRQAFDEAAIVIDRRVRIEAVALAGVEIFRAMAGRGVHDAAALLERDVISEDARHDQIKKRMPELHAFELAALAAPADFRGVEFQFL